MAERPPYQVSVPQWNDSVHIVPESFLSPGERARRRAERAKRIAASPTPQIVAAQRELLAAYDDIQDSFVTLALAGRLAVRFVPPAERAARFFAAGADYMNGAASLPGRLFSRGQKKPRLHTRYGAWPTTRSEERRVGKECRL